MPAVNARTDAARLAAAVVAAIARASKTRVSARRQRCHEAIGGRSPARAVGVVSRCLDAEGRRERGDPALVLGGSGYVAGELLRLLAGHPRFAVAAVALGEPGGRAGRRTASPHLAGRVRRAGASRTQDAVAAARRAAGSRSAVFSAAPHGAAAAARRPAARCAADAAAATVAGRRPLGRLPLRATRRLRGGLRPSARRAGAARASSSARVPEHRQRRRRPRARRASRLLHHRRRCSPRARSSRRAGRAARHRRRASPARPAPAARRRRRRTTPSGAATCSPTRRSPHRHEPEMRGSRRRSRGGGRRGDGEPEISFVPQSGPFARGIHATLARSPARHRRRRAHGSPLDRGASRAAVYGSLSIAETEPFVLVTCSTARRGCRDVVGTNRCRPRRSRRAATRWSPSPSIDNLVKGAAGGARAVDEPPVRPARDRGARAPRPRLALMGAEIQPREEHRHRHCRSPSTPDRSALLPVYDQLDLEPVARRRRLARDRATAAACSTSTAATRWRCSATATRGSLADARSAQARALFFQSNAVPLAVRERAAARARRASRPPGSRGSSSSTAAPRRTRTRCGSPSARPGGSAVVALEGAFHGRTAAAAAVTWKSRALVRLPARAVRRRASCRAATSTPWTPRSATATSRR